TLQVVLTIPSGSNCTFLSSRALWWAKRIKNLVVSGYGAKLTTTPNGGFFLGGSGQVQDSAHSARLATVSAGPSPVRLTSPAQSNLFTVGQYALITGFDLQGLWNVGYGYPSNPHFFEYALVTAVDRTAGVVTFAAPLKNTYKSTWPNYNSGSRFEIDSGGPATLYALDASWDTQVEYDGLTISTSSQPGGQIYSNGRSVTFRDVTVTDSQCLIPSQNLTWTAINVTMASCIMEADKLIGTMTFTGGTINAIDFQSSSIDLLVMDGTKVPGYIHGTPKK